MRMKRYRIAIYIYLLTAVGILLPAMATVQAKDAAASPYGLPISAQMPYKKKRTTVLGHEMAYVDEGEGTVVLFLHGNPTSSYLWRNVIPPVVAAGYRAVAPDLIGMGESDKPNIGYTFVEHAEYLDAFVDQLDADSLILVVHDWGSALGMRYARLNPDRVEALAYMEAIVAPTMPAPSLEAMGPTTSELFKSLRSPAGEEMVLENNFFIETVLPQFGVMRTMTEIEMNSYRAPYPTPESRRPTLVWPRQIPIAGEPADVVKEIEANSKWLTRSPIPKLLFWAEPGSLMPKPAVDWHVANVSALETRFVGAGRHFLQEDHPHLIGQGIVDWLRRLR